MKKIILLLFASVVSVASTTGNIRVFNENETDIVASSRGISGNHSFLGIESEIKIPNWGLSFGGLLKGVHSTAWDHLEKKTRYYRYIDEGKVWAKYELPELKGLNSYIKTEYEYTIKRVYNSKGAIILEADANYKLIENIKLGINTEAKVDLVDRSIKEKVHPIYKIYAKGDYKMIKDIEVELGIKHDLEFNKLYNVFLNAKASYKDIKDLTLTGKIEFNHLLNKDVHEYLRLNTVDMLGFKETAYIYTQFYSLESEYTGIKDLTLSAKAYVQHAKHNEDIDANPHYIVYGAKLEADYKGFKNITLSSKNSIDFMTLKFDGDTTHDLTAELNAKAEYNYKLNDKLEIKPSFDLRFIVNYLEYSNTKLATFLTPGVSAEYKVNDNITIKGEIKSSPLFLDKKYHLTNTKSNLEVKYTW